MDEYVPDHEDAVDAFRGAVEQAVINLRRTFDLEVRGLRRCNRFACSEIERLQAQLDGILGDVANESRLEIISQLKASERERIRLSVENAKLVIELSGTREQLAVLQKVVG